MKKWQEKKKGKTSTQSACITHKIIYFICAYTDKLMHTFSSNTGTIISNFYDRSNFDMKCNFKIHFPHSCLHCLKLEPDRKLLFLFGEHLVSVKIFWSIPNYSLISKQLTCRRTHAHCNTAQPIVPSDIFHSCNHCFVFIGTFSIPLVIKLSLLAIVIFRDSAF